MLRVKIEIVPFGEEASTKPISTLYIGNVCTHRDKNTADYGAWLDEDPRIPPRPAPHGEVHDYDRALGAVRLTELCLAAIRKNKKGSKKTK